MSGILQGLAIGAGSGVASAGLGLLGAKIQQDYYKENQERAFAMAQNEAKMRASNAKQGFTMAGLNPAMAADGKFAPASAPSSPLGSMSYPVVDFANAKLALSQADKNEAEAQSINIDNDNKTDANLTAQYNLERFFNKLRDEALSEGDEKSAKIFGEMAERAGSVGALKSLHDYFNMADDAQLYALHNTEYQFTRKVVAEQYKRGIFKDVAQLPRTQRLHYVSEMKKNDAMIKNLNMDTKSTEADIKLTEAEVERVKFLARQLNNSDINSMIAEGRYAQAAAVIATHWIDIGGEQAIEGAKTVATKKVPTKIQSIK